MNDLSEFQGWPLATSTSEAAPSSCNSLKVMAGRTTLPRSGFSLTEVVVVIFVISILMSFVVPAIQAARDSARCVDCMNRMKQVGVALHQFETAHRTLPSADPFCNTDENRSVTYRSWQFQLLPYLEQDAIHERLANTLARTHGIRMNSPDRLLEIPILHCPSEPVSIGMNFRFCSGKTLDTVSYGRGDGLGVDSFGSSCQGRSLSEITDGLSNTTVMSERSMSAVGSHPYDRTRDVWYSGAMELGFRPLRATIDEAISVCSQAPASANRFFFPFVGHNLLDHGYLSSTYSHVLPPNSSVPDCSMRSDGADDLELLWGADPGFAIVSARSLHRNLTVNRLNADGSVTATDREIDTEIWRALSTIQDSD